MKLVRRWPVTEGTLGQRSAREDARQVPWYRCCCCGGAGGGGKVVGGDEDGAGVDMSGHEERRKARARGARSKSKGGVAMNECMLVGYGTRSDA